MTDPGAPNPQPVPLEPRELLGERWEVLAALPGAMGTVLLLRDPSTGARFAAKTPRVEQGLSRETLRRFEAEARTWLAMGHHENVVEALFFEVIEWRGVERPFLFLEYVDGPTLDRLRRAEGRLAVPAVLDLATGIAWGMAHAHGEDRTGIRIVHRDLKPDNVFVTLHRVAKVSDFGIARALDRPEEAASEGHGLGTPYYAAPEQMRDARRADVRSDVYSFGAVLHEMLAGEPPFPSEDLSTLVFRTLREPARSLRERFPEVPESVDRLVLDCLAKEPGARPQTFAAILERLGDAREEDSVWAPPPRSRSCGACGWISISASTTCGICGKRTLKGARYAPASPRWDRKSPTLGRTGDAAEPRIERLEVRPRSPRAGEEVVITALLGNAGSAPAENVSLPFVRPSRDAFAFVESRARRGFRGTVPPTAGDAPLRVSWTLRPLREGKWTLRAPRLSWRDADGRRRASRGEPVEIVVQANDSVPMVGRQSERAALLSVLDDASSRTGALAMLLGMPGSGKTRLAREWLSSASGRGFAAARGRCLDRGVDIRGALKEALRQILDLPKGGSGAEIAAAVVAFLGDAARSDPRLLPFLTAELLAQGLPEGASAEALWARFASAAGRTRPLALVIEDVHRDPEIGAIVVAMAAECRRAKIPFAAVLTARPEIESGAAAEVVRDVEAAAPAGSARVRRLGPLETGDVADLLDGAFRPNDFGTSAPWLAEEIRALSGGMPFLVTELVRGLRARTKEERPLLVTEGGAWTAGAELTPERLREVVPPRIEEAVAGRVRALPGDARRFALAAAVLGDVFETDLLRAILPPDAPFDGPLAVLEEEGVLREVEGESPRIRFREPIIPDALRAWLRDEEPALYRELHGKAADALAARPASRGRNALRLGRHLRDAGRPALAFEAFLDAAHRLIDRQAFRKAAAALEEAESLLASGAGFTPKRALRVDFELLRGDARRATGDYPGALASYQSVIGTIGDSGSPSTLANVYARMGRVHEALGQTDDALYCHAVALSIRREHGIRHEVPDSLADLAAAHLARGETERAGAYAADAAAAATETGNRRAMGRALVLEARMMVSRGQMIEVRRLLRRALAEARAARDDMVASDAWSAVGTACIREGRIFRALVHHRKALRLRQNAGDQAAVAMSWGAVGGALESRGDIEQAQIAFERAAELFRRMDAPRGLAPSLTSLGRVQLRAGSPRKALATLEEAAAAGRSLGDAPVRALTEAELAAVLTLTGDHRAALASAAEGIRRAERCADHDLRAYASIRAAEASLAAGAHAEARERIDRALGVPGVSPAVRAVALTVASACSDDVPTARNLASEAVELTSTHPDPTVRARALAAAGRADLRAGDRPRAAATLRRAAGLLMTSSWPDPLRAAVQWDLAEALVGIDSDAAAAAARRAEDLVRELRARGFEVARPRSPESPAETVPSGGAPCDTIPRREDAHPLIPTSHLQDLQQVPALRSRFQGDLLAGGLGGDELDGWNLIFTELVNNAIEHGCRSPGDAVGVAWGVSEACVTLAVVEPGECKITERDFDSADADGFAENGRGAGLFLIRAFVDVIRVSPADGGTEIRITRMRAEPGAGGGGER